MFNIKKIIMNTYKIAVIGGTGKSGEYLVQHLLEKGYSLKLLVRCLENQSFESQLIEVVKGDARDETAIYKLIEGTDLVISTLGQPKGEESIFSDAAKNIIRVMNHLGISRYIVTTGLSVNTPSDQKNEKVKMATDWMYQNYPETTADKQKEYELLLESNLEWTLVRLPLINFTDENFATEANLTDCKGRV